MNQSEIDKIKSYLDGKASEENIIQIENIFAKGESDINLKKFLKNDWDSLKPDVTDDIDHLLHKIHHLIRLKEATGKQSVLKQIINIYSRVAAILLLLILFAGIWVYLNPRPAPVELTEQTVYSSIHAPMGSRVSFNLPDGSTGFLNSGSALTYATPFTGNRKIELQGEAWFDVMHNEQSPFEVNAGVSSVRVLGTNFNLRAYPEEKFVEVVLAEGSVEFLAKPNAQPIEIAPSERMVYTDKGIHVKTVDPGKYKGWTEGKLIFRGDKMDDVARRLEHWFNIEVVVEGKMMDDYSFRATFEDDTLHEVLRLLSRTSPMGYRLTPRKLLPDGTWQKEKVTFYKKSTNQK